MSKLIRCALMLTMVLVLSGCLVIVKEEKQAPPPPLPVPVEDCPVAAGVISEIDAVSKMAFDNDKEAAFKAIARREHLCDGPQVHLVDAVFSHLSFENNKEAVLLTLIENPQFSPAGEKAILDRIDRLAFEHSKRRILAAINARHG